MFSGNVNGSDTNFTKSWCIHRPNLRKVYLDYVQSLIPYVNPWLLRISFGAKKSCFLALITVALIQV